MINDKNNQKNIFKLPILLVILQSLINYLISLFLLIFPIIIFVFLFLTFQDIFVDFFIVGFIISGLFSLLILYFFFETFYEPKIGWYKKFKEYFFRKWILKNIKCPKCDGLINKYEQRFANPEYIFEYFYRCSSCKKKFYLEPTKKFGGWKLVEYSSISKK